MRNVKAKRYPPAIGSSLISEDKMVLDLEIRQALKNEKLLFKEIESKFSRFSISRAELKKIIRKLISVGDVIYDKKTKKYSHKNVCTGMAQQH